MHDSEQSTETTVTGDTMADKRVKHRAAEHNPMKLAVDEICKQQIVEILRWIHGILSNRHDSRRCEAGRREGDDRINVLRKVANTGTYWPSIVPSGNDLIDLIIIGLTVFRLPQIPGVRVKGEPETIAMTVAIDGRMSRRVIEKWIVGRDRPVRSYSEHFPMKRSQVLCVSTHTVVSHKNVQHSIRSELENSAIVNTGGRYIVKEHRGI